MTILVINLWLISLVFLGSIIACLEDIKNELKDINSRLTRSIDGISSANKYSCASLKDSIDKMIRVFKA